MERNPGEDTGCGERERTGQCAGENREAIGGGATGSRQGLGVRNAFNASGQRANGGDRGGGSHGVDGN